MIKNVIMFL